MEAKLLQPPLKSVEFVIKLEIDLPHVLAIRLLGIYPKNLYLSIRYLLVHICFFFINKSKEMETAWMIDQKKGQTDERQLPFLHLFV